MPKMKSHKGLHKRVKVTGRGKVKFAKIGKGHLNSHMRGTKLQSLRRQKVAKRNDIPRLERMLQRPLKPGN